MILWSKTTGIANIAGGVYLKMGKVYIADCWYCHEPLVSSKWAWRNRAFHEDCFELYEEKRDKDKEEYVRLKVEMMYERALRMMEKQDNLKMNLYKEAAEAVYELAKRDSTKFASSAEMVAAMELINNRVKIKIQYPVNRRRIDILIPDWKVALEIDGSLHQYRIGKDSKRTIEILGELNKEESGWEVIRIPTKYIEANVSQLVPAIKTLYNERQQLRKENGGFIPSYYSRHNRSEQLIALEGIVDKSKEMIKSPELEVF